jgi:nitroreductase
VNFQELLNKRYSVRSFESKPVENENLQSILEAARIAPTAGNKQPQRILVVQEPKGLEKIDLCTPCRYNSPLVLIVCYDKTVCWTSPFDEGNSGQVDASIVTTYMMLEAEDVGLNSVWVMKFDPAKAIEQFHFGENIVPVSLLVVGYPAKDAQPSDKHSLRFPVDQMLL